MCFKNKRKIKLREFRKFLKKFLKSLQSCVCRKVVLNNFTKFIVKQLHRNLFFNNVDSPKPATLLKKRQKHMCVSVTFAIFLRAPIQENICKRLLLKTGNISFLHGFMGLCRLKYSPPSAQWYETEARGKFTINEGKALVKGKFSELLLVSR